MLIVPAVEKTIFVAAALAYFQARTVSFIWIVKKKTCEKSSRLFMRSWCRSRLMEKIDE